MKNYSIYVKEELSPELVSAESLEDAIYQAGRLCGKYDYALSHIADENGEIVYEVKK